MIQTNETIKALLARCTYLGYEWDFDENQLRVRVSCPDGVCNETGARISWNGRWWYLQPGMTNTEIVQTLFLAIRVMLEHEARELFRFDEMAIFDSHTDIERLWDAKVAERIRAA